MQRISSFFKRIFAAVLAFFMMLVPAKSTGDVQVSVPAITTATESFDLTITNNTKDAIGYGLDAFTIEQRTPLGWAALKKSGNYVVIEVLRMLDPGETGTLHVNLPLVYGKTLDAGMYRLTFEYFTNLEKMTSSVTFTVGAAV
ncbi:MAG: hypothetical protein IJL52_08985 [Clostridia bacterium]|nr:hypothetical protein [Clostridia bacterium]